MPMVVARGDPSRSGSAAVEFALVAPLLMALVLGTMAYGYVFWVRHGVQQLASEAARAAVRGLSDGERDGIVRRFVAANAPSYGILDRSRLTVETTVAPTPFETIQVTVSYDLSGTFIYGLAGFVPLPAPLVERRAAIQRGGD